MLICLNSAVQITDSDQILRLISSKRKTKLSYSKFHIQIHIKYYSRFYMGLCKMGCQANACMQSELQVKSAVIVTHSARS